MTKLLGGRIIGIVFEARVKEQLKSLISNLLCRNNKKAVEKFYIFDLKKFKI